MSARTFFSSSKGRVSLGPEDSCESVQGAAQSPGLAQRLEQTSSWLGHHPVDLRERLPATSLSTSAPLPVLKTILFPRCRRVASRGSLTGIGNCGICKGCVFPVISSKDLHCCPGGGQEDAWGSPCGADGHYHCNHPVPKRAAHAALWAQHAPTPVANLGGVEERCSPQLILHALHPCAAMTGS